MKILITGNMGYVGPWVVKKLRDDYPEARLIGYDLGLYAHCLTGTAEFPERLLDGQIFGDVRNLNHHLLKGFDVLIYLAAISNDSMGEIEEEFTQDINYRSAIRWAKAAKENGVSKFIYASSCSVYGCADDGPRTESSPVNPLTAYAQSKISTEINLKAIADESFQVTCLRFATACGMSERLRLDLVLNDFVAGAFVSGEIKILSDGSPWRPLIHVSDMARAISWAAGRSLKLGGPFLIVNAGSDQWNYRVLDLAEKIAVSIPDVRVSINPDAQPDKRSYRVDFGLFRSLAPDAQPLMTLEGTILELKEAFEKMKFSDSLYRNSNLIRLNVLKDWLKRSQYSNKKDSVEAHQLEV